MSAQNNNIYPPDLEEKIEKIGLKIDSKSKAETVNTAIDVLDALVQQGGQGTLINDSTGQGVKIRIVPGS